MVEGQTDSGLDDFGPGRQGVVDDRGLLFQASKGPDLHPRVVDCNIRLGRRGSAHEISFVFFLFSGHVDLQFSFSLVFLFVLFLLFFMELSML